jgi:methyltransferase
VTRDALALLLVMAWLVAERVAELAWARRNERWLRSRGATEHGAGHYPLIVLLHGGFLASLALEASLRGPGLHARWPAVAAGLLAATAVRYWCLASLGRRWSTRILVMPGAALVRTGPYRWLKHPNYAVVVLELLLYPLLFHAWWTMAWASVANAFALRTRIAVEERALGRR